MTTSPQFSSTPLPETEPATANLANSVKPVASVNPQRTLLMSRRIGYSLLALCFVDLVYVLVPPEFTNPVWEYQTVGDLIKLVPVPLLALMLIFYGETLLRSNVERWALRILSWITLMVGIILLLLIPLIVTDAARINRFNNNQIDTQVSQQTVQLDETKNQLEKATPAELRNLVPIPDQTGNLPDVPNTPEQAKNQVLTNIARAREQAKNQAEEARSNVRRNLFKNTIKLTLESFIAGFSFVYIWIKTDWARRSDSYRNEPARRSTLASLPQAIFKKRSRRRL